MGLFGSREWIPGRSRDTVLITLGCQMVKQFTLFGGRDILDHGLVPFLDRFLTKLPAQT